MASTKTNSYNNIIEATEADWTTLNLVLPLGRMGIETDTGKFKVGDGSTGWTSLDYVATGAGGGGGSTIAFPQAEVFSGSSPTSWTDLDLSGTVGSNEAYVFLKINAGSDMNAVSVRQNGDTDEFYSTTHDANAYGCALGHHDANVHLVLSCVTDASGVIEWNTESNQTATVDVIMYIK